MKQGSSVPFGPPAGAASFSPPHPFPWLMSTGHLSDLFARTEAQNAFRGKSLSMFPSDPVNQVILHEGNANEQKELSL